jgi:hypothetical protein
VIFGLLTYFTGPVMAASGAKPDFEPNVLIFNLSIPAATIQKQINKVYAVSGIMSSALRVTP